MNCHFFGSSKPPSDSSLDSTLLHKQKQDVRINILMKELNKTYVCSEYSRMNIKSMKKKNSATKMRDCIYC